MSLGTSTYKEFTSFIPANEECLHARVMELISFAYLACNVPLSRVNDSIRFGVLKRNGLSGPTVVLLQNDNARAQPIQVGATCTETLGAISQDALLGSGRLAKLQEGMLA